MSKSESIAEMTIFQVVARAAASMHCATPVSVPERNLGHGTLLAPSFGDEDQSQVPRMRGRDGTRATRDDRPDQQTGGVPLVSSVSARMGGRRGAERASSWSRSKGLLVPVHGEQHSCTHARIWLNGHRSGLAYRSL